MLYLREKRYTKYLCKIMTNQSESKLNNWTFMEVWGMKKCSRYLVFGEPVEVPCVWPPVLVCPFVQELGSPLVESALQGSRQAGADRP